MRNLVYSMNVSLDGYVTDPDGDLNWSGEKDLDLFRAVTEETRGLSAYIMGRRLYEIMLYWETVAEDPSLDEDDRAWIAVWNPLPKVVFSTTLSTVEGTNARLATGTLAEEIERLRAEPGDGDISIGGPTLAAEAARLDLIDEYRPRVHPVLVGGGTPFYPHDKLKVGLELVESHRFPSQCVASRYRRRRQAPPARGDA